MIGPYFVNTEARRKAAWGQPCKIPFAKVTIDGRSISVHRDVVAAFEVWESIRAKHNYRLTGTDTGAYSCRYIGGTKTWSAHAWATAMDINWLENPLHRGKLVTDMPMAMIREVQALRTTSGVFVFMWGGDWDRNPSTSHSVFDAMHHEVIAHPLDLATGFDTELAPPQGDNMGLKAGMRGGGVKALQIHLNHWRPAFALTEDSIYGTSDSDGGRTGAAVAEYQRAAGFIESPLHADDTTLLHLYTNALRNPETMKRVMNP